MNNKTEDEMNIRITRRGALAVHLMPRYHGRTLQKAVERIAKHGPRDKQEQGAVLIVNNEDFGNEPKFPTGIAASGMPVNEELA